MRWEQLCWAFRLCLQYTSTQIHRNHPLASCTVSSASVPERIDKDFLFSSGTYYQRTSSITGTAARTLAWLSYTEKSKIESRYDRNGDIYIRKTFAFEPELFGWRNIAGGRHFSERCWLNYWLGKQQFFDNINGTVLGYKRLKFFVKLQQERHTYYGSHQASNTFNWNKCNISKIQ